MMSVPKEIDEKIRNQFDVLILEAKELVTQSGVPMSVKPFDMTKFRSLTERMITLVNMLLGNSPRAQNLVSELQSRELMDDARYRIDDLLGLLGALKEDYENGMLEDIYTIIENNVNYDFMQQAEQLIDEGTAGQYDHVPAAVLTGAVLEDALRRLCQRQNPPIDILKKNGDLKTAKPLIESLQQTKKNSNGLFNKATTGELEGWVKIRNDAAHGNFNDFTRDQVERMIDGVKSFLAKYL